MSRLDFTRSTLRLAAVMTLALLAGGGGRALAQPKQTPPPTQPGRPLPITPKFKPGAPPPGTKGNTLAAPAAGPTGPTTPATPTKPTPAPSPVSAPAPTASSTGGTPADEGVESDLYRCKKYPKNARIRVTLKPETELKDLVTWVMGFTCKNFIYGTGISGRAAKVTVIAPSEMSPTEAYRLFTVALQTMNLTVVPKGQTLEIVESPRAKESPIPVYERPGAVPASDQIVRLVVRPEFQSVDDMAQVIAALKSKDGVVTPLPNSGIILVTDTGLAIDRMVEIIRQVDIPAGSDKIYIIRLQYSDATDMAAKLSEVFGTAAGKGSSGSTTKPLAPKTLRGKQSSSSGSEGGGSSEASAAGGGDLAPTKIMADERINALIIVASDRAYARILALVKRLDVAIEGGEGVIHVYPLENADSEALAGTLSSLISGQGGARQPTRQGGGKGTGGGSTSATSTTAGTAEAFEGQVRITNDAPTNSLVIVSSAKDFLALREVIRKLDVPRRQVFVEATILELSLDKTRNLGTSYHGGELLGSGDDSLAYAGVQHTSLSSVLLSTDSLFGLAAGLRGPEIEASEELLGISIPSFGVMFQLLQNNNDVNVLSSPHILTTDNEEATIEVGQNIPFQGGLTGLSGLTSGTGTTSSLGVLQSVQRQDVTLKLKIKPHVNESDFVRLEFEQEISDVASLDFGGLGPSWTKRSVKTMIVVKDQQPVVIGGLMSDRISVQQSKVPLLGDIPILGYLFKYETKTKQKTNLLVLLTPHIIKDPSDIRKIFERKMEERREFLETYTAFQDSGFHREVDYSRKHGLLEDMNQAILVADREADMLREAEAMAERTQDEGPVEIPSATTGGEGGAGDEGGEQP